MMTPTRLFAAFLALVLPLSMPSVAADAPGKRRLIFTEYGKGPNRSVELDVEGKLVWKFKPPSTTVIFQVLSNGNTLICCGTQKRLIGVTPDKQIAWEFKAEDAPELNVTWVSSVRGAGSALVLK